MIIRGAMSLGLVWLLMPHQPDLGLSSAQTQHCARYCDAFSGGSDAKREAIMAHLRIIKVELAEAREHKVKKHNLGKEDRSW